MTWFLVGPGKGTRRARDKRIQRGGETDRRIDSDTPGEIERARERDQRKRLEGPREGPRNKGSKVEGEERQTDRKERERQRDGDGETDRQKNRERETEIEIDTGAETQK